MTLDEFISELQLIRAANGGNLQVWILDRSPIGPRAYIGEMNDPKFLEPPEKVVYIE